MSIDASVEILAKVYSNNHVIINKLKLKVKIKLHPMSKIENILKKINWNKLPEGWELTKKDLYFGTTGGGDQVPLENTGMEAPAKIMRMVDWVYTIHWLPFLPAAVWTHIGTVNNAAIWSLTLGKLFEQETLLCGNPSLTRQFTSEGIGAWEITWRFTYRKEGWNKFPRTDNAGAAGINMEHIRTEAGIAIPFYELKNFGELIY